MISYSSSHETLLPTLKVTFKVGKVSQLEGHLKLLFKKITKHCWQHQAVMWIKEIKWLHCFLAAVWYRRGICLRHLRQLPLIANHPWKHQINIELHFSSSFAFSCFWSSKHVFGGVGGIWDSPNTIFVRVYQPVIISGALLHKCTGRGNLEWIDSHWD